MNGTYRIRRIHQALAWLFVVSVLIQVLLIGLFLFAGASLMPHRAFGGIVVGILAILVAVAAGAAQLPTGKASRAGLLLLLIIVQVILPAFHRSSPVIAALHPVNALLIFWLGVVVARNAGAALNTPVEEATTATEAPAPNVH
jgi:Family of unknown function (DUF6220)